MASFILPRCWKSHGTSHSTTIIYRDEELYMYGRMTITLLYKINPLFLLESKLLWCEGVPLLGRGVLNQRLAAGRHPRVASSMTASWAWLKILTDSNWHRPSRGHLHISFHNTHDFRSTTWLLSIIYTGESYSNKSLIDGSVKGQYATFDSNTWNHLTVGKQMIKIKEISLKEAVSWRKLHLIISIWPQSTWNY